MSYQASYTCTCNFQMQKKVWAAGSPLSELWNKVWAFEESLRRRCGLQAAHWASVDSDWLHCMSCGFLNSLLEKWVWESGPKIDPATGVTLVAGSFFWPLSQTHISKREFKDGHISRFCTFFQVIQVISSGKFFSAEEVDLRSTQKQRNSPRFRILLFEKETMKTFFYKCSNSGRNESTPQTQNNVKWISSKAELEISFMKTRLKMWVWESGLKIDPATGVKEGPAEMPFSKLVHYQYKSFLPDRFQVLSGDNWVE